MTKRRPKIDTRKYDEQLKKSEAMSFNRIFHPARSGYAHERFSTQTFLQWKRLGKSCELSRESSIAFIKLFSSAWCAVNTPEKQKIFKLKVEMLWYHAKISFASLNPDFPSLSGCRSLETSGFSSLAKVLMHFFFVSFPILHHSSYLLTMPFTLVFRWTLELFTRFLHLPLKYHWYWKQKSFRLKINFLSFCSASRLEKSQRTVKIKWSWLFGFHRLGHSI